MKKILIIINDNHIYRNYIKTDAFSKIKKKNKCFFLFDKNIKSKQDKNAYFFEYSHNEKNKYSDFFLSNIFVNQSKSSTYTFKRKLFLSFNKWIDTDQEDLKKKILNFPVRFLNFLFHFLKYLYLKTPIFKFLRGFFFENLKPNKNLENKINRISPDLIIFPSKASDTYYFDLQKIAKKYHYKILYLIDNWDNVSAKSIFFENVYYAVWGKQSYKQLKQIHNLQQDKVYILGTPRFEKFFKKSLKNRKKHYKNDYILFLESTYSKEISALPTLDKIISRNKLFKNLKIVYRPHPWRKSINLVYEKNFQNVIIDKQIAKEYKNKNFSEYFQPDLDYYPSLLSNAKLVVSGLTTMVVESIIFKKKILLLAFKQSESIYSPHNLLKYFEHFKGIQNFRNIIINHSIKNLEKELVKLYKLNLKKNFEIDKKRNYFLFHSRKPYSQRLKEITDKILH